MKKSEKVLRTERLKSEKERDIDIKCIKRDRENEEVIKRDIEREHRNIEKEINNLKFLPEHTHKLGRKSKK